MIDKITAAAVQATPVYLDRDATIDSDGSLLGTHREPHGDATEGSDRRLA